MTNEDLFGDPIKTPQKPEEEIPVFSDGVRADSQEGIRRALANLKEIRQRLQGISVAKSLWQTKSARRIVRLEQLLATGIYPEHLCDEMRAERIRLQRDLLRSKKEARPWDFSLGRPMEAEAPKDDVVF
jgi:hypothetical protein